MIYATAILIALVMFIKWFVKAISGAAWLDENDKPMTDEAVKERDDNFRRDYLYH